jgi:hypothetical protein
MPIMAIYRAPGITREVYGAYEAEVSQRGAPKGGLLHMVGYDDAGLVVVDVWKTRADFEAATDARINAMLAAHNLPVAPPEIAEITGILAAPAFAPHLMAPEPA